MQNGSSVNEREMLQLQLHKLSCTVEPKLGLALKHIASKWRKLYLHTLLLLLYV